jgi:hypothetical protein
MPTPAGGAPTPAARCGGRRARVSEDALDQARAIEARAIEARAIEALYAAAGERRSVTLST